MPADTARSTGRPNPLVVGFDLDMTLVDTHERIVTCLASTLAEFGVSVPVATLSRFVGPPLALTWATVAPGLDPVALTTRYRSLHDAADAPAAPALPGALAALTAVRAVPGATMVVSAKTQAAISPLLSSAGLAGVVDEIAGDRFAEQKADVLLARGASIYVGDHTGDVAAARAAGATSVIVTTGPQPLDHLQAAAPDVVLSSLEQFPAWLAGHLRGVDAAVPLTADGRR